MNCIVCFYRKQEPKYAHLTAEEIQKVEQAVRQSFQWLEQVRNKSANAPKHQPPLFTVQQIRQEKANFEGTVNPILNKPPPKAPTPPKEESGGDNKAQEQQSEQQERQPEGREEDRQGQENMEWQAA